MKKYIRRYEGKSTKVIEIEPEDFTMEDALDDATWGLTGDDPLSLMLASVCEAIESGRLTAGEGVRLLMGQADKPEKTADEWARWCGESWEDLAIPRIPPAGMRSRTPW